MVIPNLSEFKRLADQGNLIPVFEEMHFDWETPISAFRKIDDGIFSFLLESVEGGEKWGRYSFLGSSPTYLFRNHGEGFRHYFSHRPNQHDEANKAGEPI